MLLLLLLMMMIMIMIMMKMMTTTLHFRKIQGIFNTFSESGQATGPTPTPPSPINQWPSHRTFTHNPKPSKPVDLQLATSQQLLLHATHTKNCFCVMPPEDGRLMPETCKGLRHNKVIVNVKVC
jgi:hypothetical protein